METVFKIIKLVFTHSVFAGIVGAILAVIWHRPDTPMIIFYLVSGIAAAGWGTEPIMQWQEINATWKCIISMILGGFTGSFMSMIFKFFKSGAAQRIIEDFFRRGKQ